MAKFSKSISTMDEFRMGQVSKKYSYHTSIINAYKEASKVDNTISINYEINSLVLYYRPTKVKNLRIGDIITKVNGEPITEENYQEMIENTRKKEISLTIKRNENEFT